MIGLPDKRKLVYVSFLATCTAIFCFASSSLGFTIDDVLDNNTPGNYSDDLKDAARWTNTSGSLVEDGVRGLGGGIEYAVAEDFCDRIIPRFIDEPKPTCNQLIEVIQRAFDKWAAGLLRFTDVTGKIRPELPPAGHPSPWIGFGAEIDFFSLSPAEFPRVRRFGAYTSFWYLFADPIGTNGRILPGRTLTSADIVFNADAPICYHIDPALTGRDCNHFESLVLHEIGHALGLDHPNEFPYRNFDTDDDPTNPIPIDCEDPTKGLKLSPNIDPKAVMNSSLGQPEPVHVELTNDDLGGRDFLYPLCPSKAPLTLGSWLGFVCLFVGLVVLRSKTPTRTKSGGRQPCRPRH